MSAEPVKHDGSKTPDWLDWIKQQAENPSSLLNDQFAAEFAAVMERIGAEAAECNLDSGIVEMLRTLVFDKLMAGQIAEHSGKRFTRERDAFLNAVGGFGATGSPDIDDRVAELKQKAMDHFSKWEVSVRLFDAIARGRAYTLETAIKAITNGQ